MAIDRSSSTQSTSNTRFARNSLLKALGLIVVINLLFMLWYPLPWMGRISAYNRIFPGRLRLPYGENPERAYSLSLYNLDAMLDSHEINAGAKPAEEYRVLLIGDSATWGFLLQTEHTLSGYLNAAQMSLPDGRQVRVYNLGYPVMSLTKDLLILSYAMDYDPDLIVWPLTLESFPYSKQLFPPLLQNNPMPVRALIEKYQLNMDPNSPELNEPSYLERTIVGARRELADLVRLQIYGVMWAATGIDQDIPETFTPRMEDLPADKSFHDLTPPRLFETDLAFDVLGAGVAMAGEIPVLIINEPIFISQGENSQIRYNFYYPRWAYDDYRQLIREISASQGWHYRDMWDIVPLSEFTNSAVHLTPKGSQQFAHHVGETILNLAAR